MKILIIGSKGFIGSHCVKYFSNGNDVWQCDVVTDHTLEKYFLLDSTNADYCDIFESQQFDVCINCSGAASVPDSLKNPQRDFVLNTVNVFKQLDAIRKLNATCKYINLSSAAVYGNPKYLPIDENHPLNPISPYGIHKKMAEDICKEFHENYNIATCSLRIFSAYGNGLEKQLFWDLYKKSDSKNQVQLFGTGAESRDFIHIKDLVLAINKVIQYSNFKNDIINIASSKEITIECVASIFFKYFNSQIQVVFEGKTRLGDPINWVANTEKLQKMNFEQSIPIEVGLKEYTEWLKERE
ncbi:NAD-dependent epimerase/dehydratase family protein [Flavobacterium glaciei]|uniref:UDP-glucose 4-epimerase n=1 Tax=Flavobacterium glaciei TaxID=386300 RepID=A0A562Q5Y6_9FLAO|nr:SDR family oxidoreductase [Flavobacterium glaciei]RDI58348.1 dTDP-glucose 4,6-dehydratase/UDP-glucose 4-epimerase [Flavobacterium glaciei]TWI52133.1 dTDP-glucose 4,6-dehydratase/UDP-glucose 4-epimerase [Flavobacterium glaciei]